MKFVELHASSAFSFLRAGSFPEQLAEVAAELEMPAIALCDRNGVYGAQRFSVAAREHGVRPIVGAELSMDDGGILPVLVENRIGYKNLCELLTQAHLHSEKGKCEIKWDELLSFAEGLVALFNASLLDNGLRKLLSIFSEQNLFVEIQRHFVRGEGQIDRQLVELARLMVLPLLATYGVQYAKPYVRVVLDGLTCIRELTHLVAAGML